MKKEGRCVCIPNGQKRAKKKEVEETKGKSTNEQNLKKEMNRKKKGQNDLTTIKMLKEMVLHLFKLWP
jgi:hypothetical protein